jgi:hypothetical protein
MKGNDAFITSLHQGSDKPSLDRFLFHPARFDYFFGWWREEIRFIGLFLKKFVGPFL